MAKWDTLSKVWLITKRTILVFFLWIAHFNIMKYTPLSSSVPSWLESCLVLYLQLPVYLHTYFYLQPFWTLSFSCFSGIEQDLDSAMCSNLEVLIFKTKLSFRPFKFIGITNICDNGSFLWFLLHFPCLNILKDCSLGVFFSLCMCVCVLHLRFRKVCIISFYWLPLWL